MALIYIKDVGEGARLGLWRMDEEPGELLLRHPHLRRLDMPYKNVGRQREYLCVRALLKEMTADESLRIDHTQSGRPVVEGWAVSISHTRGYAALMLARERGCTADMGRSPRQALGVDIEYRSDRIARIASHFIRPDEMGGDALTAAASGCQPAAEAVERMLILWCAKETLYKLHSGDNLHYFDMRLAASRQPLPGAAGNDGEGVITLENMKRGEQVTIHVTLTADYCLTWAAT